MVCFYLHVTKVRSVGAVASVLVGAHTIVEHRVANFAIFPVFNVFIAGSLDGLVVCTKPGIVNPFSFHKFNIRVLQLAHRS